ncbi:MULTISPECIES: CHAT domain-containing protein [unclassified Isoptericola]|uniref:CHAT domain-containing protein n=1 Tax=unclassified Isoptericola TaxID=2623355 RepID=UPI00365FB7D4
MDGLEAVLEQIERARTSARSHRRFGLALRTYRAALRRLDGMQGPGGADVVRARARVLVGIATCEYERGAERDVVLDLLDAAQVLASGARDESMVAVVQGHRGLQLMRMGDLAQARAELDAALVGIMDERDLVPVLINRGWLCLETGELDVAVRDLERARELAHRVGETAVELMAEHNLGYARYLGGDLPAALRAMDAAAESSPPEHAGIGLMDKAAVLYEAGLLTEAAEALGMAADVLADTRAWRDLIDAQLGQARCLVGLGRYDEAMAVARRVRGRARRAGHDLLDLRAGLITIDARHEVLVDEGAPPRAFLRLAHDAARLAERARALPGADRVAVDLDLVVAEGAVRGGRPDVAAERLRRLPPPSGLSLGTQLRAQVVRALAAFADEDRRRGLAAVRRGHQLLAQHRQRLGSVEAVTAASVHGIRLQSVDLDAAMRSGRPDAVFDAVERGRATFAGSGRVQPPEDPEMAALVGSARRLAERARQLEGDATSGIEQARLRRDARRLQSRARERSWHADGHAGVPQATSARALRAELRAAGSDRTVLDLMMIKGRVCAVRVDGGGTRLLDLAPLEQTLEQARRVRADLGALSNPLLPPPLRATVSQSLARSLAWLDDALLRGADVDGPVYIAARDRLVSVPWSMLPSRRGVSTVVNSWVTSGDGGWEAGSALAVAGPGLRLAGAEAAEVARVWGSAARTLVDGEATCAAVAGAVKEASVVHLATHGSHEPDNPVFSSLLLADGPLFAHELDGHDLTRAVMVLSACDVGSASIRQGGEPLGLTSVLLRMGARAVIASVAPLRDDVAVRVMPVLHVGLRDGLRPGEALARAVADEPEPVPLVCFGPLVL